MDKRINAVSWDMQSCRDTPIRDTMGKCVVGAAWLKILEPGVLPIYTPASLVAALERKEENV